jgi:arginine/lysine/ornithine decarboxylase
VFHVQGDLIDAPHLAECADLLMTTSPNVMIYAALDGWRRQMVENGENLLDAGPEPRRRRARRHRPGTGPSSRRTARSGGLS